MVEWIIKMKTIFTFFALLMTGFCFADDYRLDQDFKSSISTCNKDVCYGVEAIGRVEKRGKKYLYIYKLKNLSKTEPCLVYWDLIHFGAYMWELKPGEQITVTLLDSDPPKEAKGRLKAWIKHRNSKSRKRYYKEIGLTLPDIKMYEILGGLGYGPLPKWAAEREK
jgi:hypothetical protein